MVEPKLSPEWSVMERRFYTQACAGPRKNYNMTFLKWHYWSQWHSWSGYCSGGGKLVDKFKSLSDIHNLSSSVVRIERKVQDCNFNQVAKKYFGCSLLTLFELGYLVLRILLKQNTALLSTVRPCVRHRRDISHFLHI